MVAHEGELILLLSGDVVHLRDVLRRLAHEYVIEGVDHTVVIHGVDETLLAHLVARAGPEDEIGDRGHGGTAHCGPYVYLAEEELLVHDLCGPEGRNALLVDRAGDGLPGTSRMDGDLPSGVGFLPCHVRVAADDLFDEPRGPRAPFHRRFEGDHSDIDTREVLEPSKEVSYGGPHAAHYNDVVHMLLLLILFLTL